MRFWFFLNKILLIIELQPELQSSSLLFLLYDAIQSKEEKMIYDQPWYPVIWIYLVAFAA